MNSIQQAILSQQRQIDELKQALGRGRYSYRERLAAARTYYLSPTGNDALDGLFPSTAWASLQTAIDRVTRYLDLQASPVTIQLADGTYNFSAPISLHPYMAVSSGLITLQGNTGTPGNVVLNWTSAVNGFQCTFSPLIWTLAGFRLQGTGGTATALQVDRARVAINALQFGANWSYHLWAQNHSRIEAVGNYSIVAGAGTHWYAHDAGIIIVRGRTITLTGTPAFSSRFAYANRLGLIICDGNTFSGSATGARYRVTLNSVIDTNGGGTTYLPGNAADGTPTATGGQYV